MATGLVKVMLEKFAPKALRGIVRRLGLDDSDNKEELLDELDEAIDPDDSDQLTDLLMAAEADDLRAICDALRLPRTDADDSERLIERIISRINPEDVEDEFAPDSGGAGDDDDTDEDDGESEREGERDRDQDEDWP